MKNGLINFTVIMSMLLSLTIKADDKALQLCDDALKSCTLQIGKQKELIKSQDELIMELIKQRNEAFKELGSAESTVPWYVWGLVGLAGGLVLGQTVIFK